MNMMRCSGRAPSSRPHSGIEHERDMRTKRAPERSTPEGRRLATAKRSTRRKARIALARRLAIIMQEWMTAPIVSVEAEGLVRDAPRAPRHVRPFMAADNPAIPSLARSACSIKAGLRVLCRRTPIPRRVHEAGSPTCPWPTSFLGAMINARTACAGSDVHGVDEAGEGDNSY